MQQIPVPEATPERKPINKWYLAASIGIAAILLFLALRKVSWQEMLDTARHAKPQYLLTVFLIGSLSVFCRGLRWGVLLSAQKQIKAFTMFWATSIGYLGNTVLPARAGELIRSLLLGEKTGLSKSYVLATALTERILDVIILVLIGVVSLPSIGTLPTWLGNSMRVMGILGAVALVILFVAPRFSAISERIIRWLPLPEKVKNPAIHLWSEFLLGASAFLHPARAAGFAGYSAIIWCLDATGVVLMSLALNLHFTFPQGFVLLLALGLSSAIPSTPGYVGVYQFVAVTLLPLYGISESQALTFIIALQAVNTSVILIWGFIGLWRLNVRSLNRIG